MSPDVPSPTLVAVVLGASKWPEWRELNNPAFAKSHEGFVKYLEDVLHLPDSRVLDLFDEPMGPDDHVRRIQAFLAQHSSAETTDVVIYYVGHGDAAAADDYALLTACASKDRPDSSTFHASFLFEATRTVNDKIRVHLIVDACFSASATEAFRQPMGSSGVAILASASRADKSYAPDGSEGTHFTRALLSVLVRGEPEGPRTLSLSKLCDLVDDELRAFHLEDLAYPELHSPHQRKGNVAAVGLFPNLAYGYRRNPGTDQGQPWCAVVSTADASAGRGGEFRDAVTGFIDRYRGQIKDETGWLLAEQPTIVAAEDVFRSARSFQDSTAAVCAADLAFFDLTHFEPAVCVLLGIRAVIRRGVTICSTSSDVDEASPRTAPFLLRDVNVVGHGEAAAKTARAGEVPEVVFGRRALTGITQLLRMPRAYSDLPAFDSMRQPAQYDDGKTIRPFSESVLVLCPFSETYSTRNWSEVRRILPGAIQRRARRDDGGRAAFPEPAVERTLDMGSPEVVSTNLFRAMRLNDLCICDLTEWRPNVLFELGLRLAANPLHPVCIIDSTAEPTNDEKARGLSGLRQTGDLQRIFEFVHYEPRQREFYYGMVDLHVRMRDELTTRGERTWSSDTLPIGGIYRVAWQYANPAHEPNGVSVLGYLMEPARALQMKSRGSSPFIFPVAHELSALALRSAIDRLVAAWLYAKYRIANGEEGLDEQVTEIEDQLSELSELLPEPHPLRDQIDALADIEIAGPRHEP
jgi:Caspase domain